METLEKLCRGLWVKQSLTFKCLARVSLSKVSLENTPSSSYTLWVKSNRQWVSWVTRDLAWVTSHSWNPSYQWLFKFHHVLLTWLVSRVSSRESIVSQVAKTTSSQILHQTLTHSPYIKSHKSTRKWLNRNTIKFDTKLKPTNT